MNETGLIPCPACGAVRHHPMTEGARTESRDNCEDPPGGHYFETVEIAAVCAVCGQAWSMTRHYGDPDASAGLNFVWRFPDGRVFHEFEHDEPADEPYAD